MSNSTGSEFDIVPRQPNGRLRFPDAFLHPEPSPPSISEPKRPLLPESDNKYKVKLIDDNEESGNTIKIVDMQDIERDHHVFNKSNIQRFIRECAQKDVSYIGGPWIVYPRIATNYNIDTTLPKDLQRDDTMIVTQRQAQQQQKLKKPSGKTADEKEAERKAKREQFLLQKIKLKEERERQREERKRQAAVKYPLEDLDLPIYRKNPNTNWTLVDMCPLNYSNDTVIPYPSGGRSDRPVPRHDSSIPPALFDTFLSIYAFVNVFSEPLKIPSFSIDEFERALLHDTHQPKATVLVEYNSCLLNVIINERKKDTTNELANGDIMESYVEDMEESDDEDDDESEKKIPRVERGWRDENILKISQKWDNKELRQSYDRRGWETTLIGCLNDVATPDLVSDLDQILQHLVPRYQSTAADREQQYPTLSLKNKLDILSFLVDVVNESTLIKDYMEYCHEQISELRRQKIELNKEFKALHVKKVEMDRRDRAEKSKKTDEEGGDESDEDSESSDDSKDDDDEDNDDDDDLSDSSMNLLDRYERRHQSRQEKLRQKQKEREEMEQLRHKMYKEQKEATKVKNQELRIKAEERKKLDEEEKILRKKEEQIEKGMRRYMTLRIRPLGKDRFYNKYIYLDNVGVSNTCGSGRLYVHSPSDIDIQMMMERDVSTDFPEQPWGYGGGKWFILTLMKEQGFIEESEWLSKRMDELDTGSPDSEYKGWWKYYSDPEDIQKLLSWLNPKGIREYKFKNELLKQQSNLVDSIKKRAHSSTKKEPINKRVTRSKSVVNGSDTWSQHK
ncbi:hypothetical protein K501DRAFT_218714 [Backusella circina FSU 941]|nr:hypothetical protein K501DRAFT_218714 [Backusella circina FSU 941]